MTLVTDHGSELWGGTVADPGAVRRLSDRLNTVLSGPTWMPDGASVLCRLVPEDRGDEPAAPRAPKGPNVRMTTGEATPLRTYQDLLASPYDGALFEYYASAELAVVSVEDGSTQSLGRGMHMQARVSPDGKFLLETLIQRPFSFVMPYYQFPHRVQVRALDAEQATLLADVPLDANIPIGGVRTGPRSFTWKASEPATLMWTEALDGGDPKVEVPHRDRWLSLGAPFDVAQAREVLRVEHRAQGLSFLADPNLLITREYDRDRRWSRSLLHDLAASDAPKVLEDRSRNDRYADPGRLLSRPGPFGVSVVRVDGDFVYRSGRGSSRNGDLPFLDRQDIVSLATTRLWRCEPGSYESVVRLMPPEQGQALAFITRHESPASPPNLRQRRVGVEESLALTAFPDPTPQLRGITKRLVRYEREDGVPLSATLYLPADHEQGTRLPLVVWAYPREFNDVRTAGQVSGSPSRFTRITGPSHLFYLTQGYAIMDAATIPIIGDAETMNDTFREQLVASAQAAIDFAVAEGVADPGRVGVGGHSYGAFMTANLLAHCDLFNAGVARSGAYNRTLTPFGFQSERRTLWESPETYFAISPFMHAQKIQAAMLMIHGEADNNSGTFPLQSRRMFQAIQGNGGTARLVMLPNEN
ncbi:MAG: prolyl oligopeptidase family serine peptidase, partial [Planctomycetota bacterium]